MDGAAVETTAVDGAAVGAAGPASVADVGPDVDVSLSAVVVAASSIVIVPVFWVEVADVTSVAEERDAAWEPPPHAVPATRQQATADTFQSAPMRLFTSHPPTLRPPPTVSPSPTPTDLDTAVVRWVRGTERSIEESAT